MNIFHKPAPTRASAQKMADKTEKLYFSLVENYLQFWHQIMVSITLPCYGLSPGANLSPDRIEHAYLDKQSPKHLVNKVELSLKCMEQVYNKRLSKYVAITKI